MKPKTNTQFRVVELSAQLPDITEEQKAWGFDHCVDKSVVRSRKTLYCLECGHSWKDPGELSTKLLGETCPSCNSKLKLKEHYSSSYCYNSGYYAILTTKGEFQVVRLFFMSKYLKKHNAANLFCSEVMQHWIDEKGSFRL